MKICSRPPLSIKQVPELVHQLYGFQVRVLEELESYDDRNVLVEWSTRDVPLPSNVKTHLTQPSRFLVKVMHKKFSCKPDSLAIKNDLSNHLTDQGFKTPCLIQNKVGTYQSIIILEEPNTNEEGSYVMKLFEFVEGIRMDKVCLTKQLCYEQGEIAGIMDKLWMNFPVENYNNIEDLKIFWNMSEMSVVRESFHHVQDQSRVLLLEEVVSQFESKVLSNSRTFSKGFINSDVNDGNTLLTKTASDTPSCTKGKSNKPCNSCENGNYYVSAVIDFGDLTYTSLLYELAIAVAYATLNTDGVEPLEAAGGVIEGYLQHVKLTKHELQYLRLSVCARLVQSFVYGQKALSDYESNEHTQLHAQHCWPMIQRLWKMSNTHFTEHVGLNKYFVSLE